MKQTTQAPCSSHALHLVGFGSQGAAWAECFRQSGWPLQVYVRAEGQSFKKAKEQGFDPQPIDRLPHSLLHAQKDLSTTHWIPMLCPDPLIAPIYREFIASCPGKVRLILAHGYAVYSGELQMHSPLHRTVLLAPKAIGPKLLQNFKSTYPNPHRLIAAFSATEEDHDELLRIARALGFARESLLAATFDEETMGDLMSEQGLLCGGVFNLLEWTMEAMMKAGIPEGLVREECLTELELIAGMIRDRGPSRTFQCISQVAQAGTIAMAGQLEESGFKQNFLAQMEEVTSRKFVRYFQSGLWNEKARQLVSRLAAFEERLEKPGASSPDERKS